MLWRTFHSLIVEDYFFRDVPFRLWRQDSFVILRLFLSEQIHEFTIAFQPNFLFFFVPFPDLRRMQRRKFFFPGLIPLFADVFTTTLW